MENLKGVKPNDLNNNSFTWLYNTVHLVCKKWGKEMNDRDRLIELLRKVDNMRLMRKGFAECADYLLANGVIVPPCKVGDKVWLINNPREYEVLNFHWTGQILWATLILIEEPTIMREIQTTHFGKTVFLTKEEAEEKLKELNNENK